MATATLTFDTSDFQRSIDRFADRAPQAIANAINRAGTSAKTVVIRDVATDIGLKPSVVRGSIWHVDATAQRQAYTLYASTKRFPLYAWGATGPIPSRGKGAGVIVRGKRYPKAFIAAMRSGHIGVFQRKGIPRLPIGELHGPSVAHVFRNHVEVALAVGHEALVKNLQSEFRFALSQ